MHALWRCATLRPLGWPDWTQAARRSPQGERPARSGVDVATIPGNRRGDALRRLKDSFFKHFRGETSALAVSLNNHNLVYHVAPMLCNLSRAEKRQGWIIWEYIIPGVARLLKLVDQERLGVVRPFGMTQVTVEDCFGQAQVASGRDLDEVFRPVAERLKGPGGPQEFQHRFITEDVPYGLVFFRSLGQVAGVKMPITEALIRLASSLCVRDITGEGHTVERLGLGALSDRDIVAISVNAF